MKFFLKNFKEFAVRGTVVDMGIGVVVGTAFIKIVNSLVTDIIMPPIGLVLGRVDFSNLYINLSGGRYRSLAEAKAAGAVTINYGVFIDTIINFAIIALVTYFTILQINRIKKAPVESMSTKECPYCFSSIQIRAVKCAHCASTLDNDSNSKAEKENEVITENETKNLEIIMAIMESQKQQEANNDNTNNRNPKVNINIGKFRDGS